jgi:hypothetical protein
MHPEFESGFEKTAVIGFGAAKSLISNFGGKIGTKLYGWGKGLGAKAVKNPVGAAGTAAGVYFAGDEALNVLGKTKSRMDNATHMGV